MKADRPPIRLTLYGRPDCTLCDRARETIEAVGLEHPLELVEVDIESDDALFRRFLELIPVIEHDGETWFELEVDRIRLVDLLIAAASIDSRDCND